MTANTVPYGSLLRTPPTSSLLLTAKREPYKKASLLTKIIEEISGGKSLVNGPAGRKR